MRDDKPRLARVHRRRKRLLESAKIVSRDLGDVLVSARLRDVSDFRDGGGIARESLSGAGVVLVSGHRSDAVVENYGRDGRSVVERGEDSRDARVEERRIAQYCADASLEAGLAHASRVADRRAHADRRVHRVEGRKRAERVAADVAGDSRAELVENVENAAVTAARAEDRRTRGKPFRRLRDLRLRHIAKNLVAEVLHAVGVELVHVELGLVLDYLYAHRLNLLFEEWVELLDDEQLLDGLRELRDERLRKRIRPAELQNLAVGEYLADVLVRNGRGDDAEPLRLRGDLYALRGLHDLVELGAVRLLLHRLSALLRVQAVLAREHRNGNVLGDVLLVGDERMRSGLEVAELDERRRVARARREAQDHRHLELLGKLERLEREVIRFLRIGRLQKKRARELREVAVVLLVLRRVHAGIVGRNKDEAAERPHVRESHQGVHRDVEPYVLHRGDRACAGHGGADGSFDRDLLVNRPFAADRVLELRYVLENLGGGSTGIGARHYTTCLGRSVCDRLVCTEELLHFIVLSPLN